MEVSVIGSSSQAKICTSRSVLSSYREIRFCNFQKRVSLLPNTKSKRWRNSGLSFTLNAVRSSPVRSDRLPHRGSSSKPKSLDGVRVFVGLPLDAVSDCNTVNHARAIAAGLRALKLLGIDGVELPVWWGIVEKESMGKYDWSGYLVLAEMIQNAGLKLHVSLCFHGSKQPKIPLPEWVSHIGDLEPSIYHADRSGDHYRECLSLAVDEVPVLNGKTPVQVYQEFCESFKSSFSNFFGCHSGSWTRWGAPISLSSPPCKSYTNIPGVGEFQCYDKNMLNLLKEKAEAAGNPLWGLGGPHDAPSYDQFPNSSQFFKDNGGSWDSPYGDFFLSWYSSELLSHGDRLLSLASTSFSNTPVTVHGKIPLMHSWYKTRAHPSELTAGFYNTVSRDGYEAVAEMFARNSCKMILPGMDLSDKHQPQESLSSPESMLAQIRIVCRKHRVEISGQNSVVSKAPHGFEQIKKNVSGASAVDLFTYQRMGADFFSPEHFPSFTHFVRNLNQLEMFSDDLPEEEEVVESVLLNSESNSRMQAA
uniref:Beta-amylase n=1 Tax=Salix viminalis TaxID=40686 RepID=A0A6N2LV43_SALVM